MTSNDEFTFGRADLTRPEDFLAFKRLNAAYFDWMSGELSRVTGRGLPEITGMSCSDYVEHTLSVTLDLVPRSAQVYFIRSADRTVVAMGGLRTLPDGATEIVRIYTLPEFRGLGLGARMVGSLITEAKGWTSDTLRLDTGIFMHSAQKIYEAAGFRKRGPYAGAEPPEFLKPYWIYMEMPASSFKANP
ncbi:MAG: GNAT family N-acetyltransferase [Alphaproteobacteria bacterium]|nr:GNAT family N-acetyltransferase [Alphaproteobacteria bacterium]